MNWKIFSSLCLVSVMTTNSADAGEERTLFEFDSSTAQRQWQAVNDGVMGGRSVGRFRMTDSDSMEFYGTLSLANNGGFASVRSRPTSLGLKSGDTVKMRVRGDGRTYSFNLYPQRRMTAFSYRTNFKTVAGKWTEVEIPVDSLVATSFGRVIRNQKLNPASMAGMGILLGDKKPGTFKLEIDWIKVESR